MQSILSYTTALLLVPLAATCMCEGATPPDKAETPAKNSMSLLFIGNSFTGRHDLPTLFSSLAGERLPGVSVQAESIIYPGKSLFQHWECYRSYNRLNLQGRKQGDLNNEINELTRIGESKDEPGFYAAYFQELSGNDFYTKFTKKISGTWREERASFKSAINRHKAWLAMQASAPAREFDYVVLQSWLDVTDSPSTGYFKYAAKFAESAKASGARPVLYLTASYAHNKEPVTQAVAKERSVGECRAALAFAKSIDAIVAPVPLAISLAQESAEPIARTLTYCYVKDFHPNHAMAYLTACTIYAAVFDKSPEGITFNTVRENKLHNIHGEVVRADAKTKDASSPVNPDGGPLERIFTDEERLFLQRTAWKAVQDFRNGAF